MRDGGGATRRPDFAFFPFGYNKSKYSVGKSGSMTYHDEGFWNPKLSERKSNSLE